MSRSKRDFTSHGFYQNGEAISTMSLCLCPLQPVLGGDSTPIPVPTVGRASSQMCFTALCSFLHRCSKRCEMVGGIMTMRKLDSSTLMSQKSGNLSCSLKAIFSCWSGPKQRLVLVSVLKDWYKSWMIRTAAEISATPTKPLYLWHAFRFKLLKIIEDTENNQGIDGSKKSIEKLFYD